MLRGINVGGHKLVNMKALQKSFEALGCDQVKTYIQSGNVVFKAIESSAAEFSTKIEQRILGDFGFEVSVVSRTPHEMRKIVDGHPFARGKGIDLSKVLVIFLSSQPGKSAVKKLEPFVSKSEKFRWLGREIYLHCPDGISQSKLTNSVIEKVLAVKATARNWNTINKLVEMASECN